MRVLVDIFPIFSKTKRKTSSIVDKKMCKLSAHDLEFTVRDRRRIINSIPTFVRPCPFYSLYPGPQTPVL